ncbi:MAG: hypothetical protein JEZ06_01640 [Anaerolineaceae bacterium]|nr:hypothetical protein [Anaerolineaceae bacterium]
MRQYDPKKKLQEMFFDGLAEIGLGIFLIIFGGFLIAMNVLESKITFLGYIPVILLLPLLLGPISDLVRRKIPSLEKMVFDLDVVKQKEKTFHFLGIASFILILIFLVIFTRRIPGFHSTSVWLLVFVAAAIAALFVLVAYLTDLLRFYLIAPFLTVYGFLVLRFGVFPISTSLSLEFMAMGEMFLVSGGIAFIFAIRKSKTYKEKLADDE